MSSCYQVRIETSEISDTDLNEVLDKWGIDVDDVDTNTHGNLVVTGISYISRSQTELANDSIVEAIQAVTPNASVSTSWREVEENPTSYQTEPKKDVPKKDVRIIAIVEGGVLRDACATSREMQSNRPQQITIDTVELVVLLECAQACLRLYTAHNDSMYGRQPEKHLDPSVLKHLVDKHMSRCTEQYERKIEKKSE